VKDLPQKKVRPAKFKNGVQKVVPKVGKQASSSSWGSNFISLAALTGAAGLGYIGYDIWDTARTIAGR
jgi:hypothetical protein